MATDERQTIVLRTNAKFKKKEFQALWNKINFKSVYEVKFDTPKLVIQSKDLINAQLHIADRVYEVRTGTLTEGTQEEMKQGSLMKEDQRAYNKMKTNRYTDTVYDIVGEIEAKTNLTRRTIVDILKAIKKEKFLLLQKNPEEFIARCSRLIDEAKASLIYKNIVYHKTEERYDAKTVFTNDKNALRNSELLKKHIYDFIETDSDTEQKFVAALEATVEIVVYAKLPKSFKIPTPVGNFSPDWAIVFDKEKVRHIYFVIETKGKESEMELRGIEKLKIHCAKEHFATISGNEVIFNRVVTYDNLMQIVQLK